MGRFKALVVKSINITIICSVVLCSLADIYHRFKGFYYLCLEGTLKMEADDSSKMLVYLHLTGRCHVADDNDDGDDDKNMTTTTTMTMKTTTTTTAYIHFFLNTN